MQDKGSEEGRMTRRRAALGALAAAVASVVVTLAAGSGIAAESNTNPRAATINPTLLDQLRANPTGGVTAIVTGWNREALDDIAAMGVVGTRLKALPMVITPSLTQAQLQKLQDSPAVRSVWPQKKLQLYMEDSTWITKARYVWPNSTVAGGPAALGVTGQGVEIAVIDTGIDGMHEDADNLIEFCQTEQADGTKESVLCTPWYSARNTGPAGLCGATNPNSDFCPALGVAAARGDATDLDVSHGTHVSGTIAGSGDASGGMAFTHSTIGMAPEAKLRVYSANVGPSLLATEILASYDDMTYKKLQGWNNVVAVSNSWGGGDGANYDASDPINVAIKRAYDAGILSVFAAGNSGPEHNTLSSECVNPYVACVAAVTKPDSVVMFSSRGRPSQPADTNRDGVIDGDDIPPDNHDRALGQKLELGLYRPTLAAPGVNINAMKAIGLDIGEPTSAFCREEPQNLPEPGNSFCYVQLNGTSMATPHVSGAVALIVQGYRQGHNNKTPTPAQITDILERSANTSKLPAWESEEQGAGRLDAYEAVKFARTYPNGLRRPNFGYPHPPYVQNMYPGSTGATTTFKGCTAAGSWTARGVESPMDPGIGQPPLSTQRYGQHFINVPEKTDRIRVTVTWPNAPGANLYARLWRPGVNPDTEAPTPDYPNRPSAFFQARVFPDQEALGLLDLPDSRLLEVRSPEMSNPSEGAGPPPAIPSGLWVLRVYDRVPGASLGCGTTQEQPPVAERAPGDGHEYNVKLELPRVTHQPSIKIDSPTPGSTVSSRFVQIKGRAGYPPAAQDPPPIGNVGHSWEGVTNWEVPGSAKSGASDENGEPDPNNPRPVLYMHGKADAHSDTSNDGPCSSYAESDVLQCNGPFLMPKASLSLGPAAFWRTGLDDELFDGTSDRSIHDPNWSWCLALGPGCPADPTYVPPGPRTVGGAMTVEWWAACNLCNASLGVSADWIIRVWGDGALKFEQRVTATPASNLTPSRLVKTVTLPTFTANQRIVVHIDPVYIDSQTVATIYYDSESPCPGATTGRCDSLVRMPVGTSGSSGGGGPAAPDNVRVTDLPMNAPYPAAPDVPALRVAWDPQQGAASYEVYRSTDPLDLGNRIFKGAGTPCTSPNPPGDAEPGYDRPGLCVTDKGVALRTTYYYRVLSVDSTGKQKSAASELAYGTPTKYDRQVKLKVDRLYGPQYWEYALDEPSPNPTKDDTGIQWLYTWDTLELLPVQHLIFGRSFTQGIGSRKDQTNVIKEGDGGSTPNCEVKVTNGGWITAMNGDRASFGGNAKSDANGVASGQEEYQDHGPATPLTVHSIVISSITCSADRKEAEIRGVARVDGAGAHGFTIRVRDEGEPGTSDRYQMKLDTGYDSGFQQLQGGNIQIH
jgi:serine protease AprX